MAQATDRSRLDPLGYLAATGVVGAWAQDAVCRHRSRLADRGGAALFGIVRPDACNGDPLAAYVEAIHPADRAAFATEIDRAAGHGAPIALQYRVSTGGVVRFVHDSCCFTLGELGRPVRGHGIVVCATRTFHGTSPCSPSRSSQPTGSRAP